MACAQCQADGTPESVAVLMRCFATAIHDPDLVRRLQQEMHTHVPQSPPVAVRAVRHNELPYYTQQLLLDSHWCVAALYYHRKHLKIRAMARYIIYQRVFLLVHPCLIAPASSPYTDGRPTGTLHHLPTYVFVDEPVSHCSCFFPIHRSYWHAKQWVFKATRTSALSPMPTYTRLKHGLYVHHHGVP